MNLTSQKPCKQEDSGVKYLKCGEKNPPQVLYLVKRSFKSEDEKKTFSDKPKLRIFVASRSDLQEMLKEVLQSEVKSTV